MKHVGTVTDKTRDIVAFHRLLVIALQILTVLLSVDKSEQEDYKFRKVIGQNDVFTHEHFTTLN
jgi:hypothetical protein